MNPVEIQRLENIKQNQQLLKELNLYKLAADTNVDSRPGPKRPKLHNAPVRSSARLASSARKLHDDNASPAEKLLIVAGGQKQQRKTAAQNQSPTRGTSRHLVQPGHIDKTNWEPTELGRSRDESGTFHFKSHPSFLPNKSPEEILREGCFGGSYFRPLFSRKLGVEIVDDYKELPSSWISGLDVSVYLTSPIYDPDVNKFKVACGQSIEEWEAAGWINHDYDVRGWFQWYCRFFQGRRCEDDARQVSRWVKCVGETGRWRRMLLKKYVALGVREVFDDGADEDVPEVSPVIHQTCHHWAFEVRQNILDDYWLRAR
jgi:hypothetical protein